MAPKQDEPETPSNDNYEPQPVDNVDEFAETPQTVENEDTLAGDSQAADSSSGEADGATPADEDGAKQADQTESSEPSQTETNEPAVATSDGQSTPAETQTTYINPDNSSALAGAGAMSTMGKPGMSRRKKLVLAVVVGLIVVLAILAGLWFWYNSTNKVMGDAVSQLLSKPITSSQGNFSFADQSDNSLKLNGSFSTRQAADKSSEFTMKLNFNGGGADVQVPLDVIAAANGDLYVKVSQVKQLLGDVMKSQNATPAEVQQMQTYFGGLINKIDDKWVKISKTELDQLTSQASSSQADVSCAQTALQQFYASADQQNEIKKAFTEHPLFTIDKSLGSKTIDGHSSLGYSLSSDNAKADAFSKAVAGSQLAQNLKKCGDTFGDSTTGSNDSTDNPTVHAEAWVDRWNHQFTQLSLSVKDKTTDVSLNLKPSFDKPAGKIDTPQNFTTISELKTQLQQTLGGLMMAEMSAQSSSAILQ